MAFTDSRTKPVESCTQPSADAESRDRELAELAELVGLDPTTLVALFAPKEPTQTDSLVVVRRMTRLVDFVPLSEVELACLENVFVVGPQARVAGSTILNDLLRHACGASWDKLEEPLATRMRFRRGAKMAELARLAEYVKGRPDLFSRERIAQFEVVARLESDVRRRMAV